MFKDLSEKQGILIVFLSGICWGFSGACGEYIVNHKGLSVNTLIPIRLFAAGLLTLAFCKISGIGLHFAMFKNKKHLIRLLCFSFFGIFTCQYFYFWGISLSNAAIATVIQYTAPVFIILIVCAEQKRLPTLIETSALLLVLSGAFFLATGGDFDKLLISPKALFICFLSAVGSVGYSLIPRKLNSIYSPLPVLGFAMSICGFLFCLKEQIWAKDFNMDLELFLALFAVIVIGTVIAFGGFMIGLNAIGAAKASIIASNEPVAAAVIAYLWLGSALLPMQIFGFCLIMLAIFLTMIKRK